MGAEARSTRFTSVIDRFFTAPSPPHVHPAACILTLRLLNGESFCAPFSKDMSGERSLP